MHSLQGKSVLITGAGSGIGKACAIAFAESGASVTAVDMDLKLLKDLKSDYSLEIIEADLTSPEKFFPNNLEIDIKNDYCNIKDIIIINKIKKINLLKLNIKQDINIKNIFNDFYNYLLFVPITFHPDKILLNLDSNININMFFELGYSNKILNNEYVLLNKF